MERMEAVSARKYRPFSSLILQFKSPFSETAPSFLEAHHWTRGFPMRFSHN